MSAKPSSHPHARSAWTDERLDDLVRVIRDGFARNEADHQAMREEMNTRCAQIDRRLDRNEDRFDRIDDRFDRVDDRFDRIDLRFERMDQRFERMEDRFATFQRVMAIGMLGIAGTVLATLAATVTKL